MRKNESTYLKARDFAVTNWSMAAGVWLAAMLVVAMCAQACVFMLGGCAAVWVLGLAAVAATGGVFAYCSDCKLTFKGALAGALICLFCALAASCVEDYSYDGNGYHQMAVACMMDGWNPYLDPPVESLWASHYAKGMEMLEAIFALAAGTIEAGKGLNGILLATTALVGAGFAGQRGLSRWHASIIGMTLAISPITMAQLPTFYIDYAKCYFDALLLIFLIQALSSERQWPAWTLTIGVGVMASMSKFNFFFETGLIFLGATAWLLFQRRPHDAGKVVAAGTSVAILTFILGYHPYITNWLYFGHPLFPLMGDGAVDIMSLPESQSGATGWRVPDFFASMLSFQAVASVDTRMGGFSILMPILLIACCIAIWKCRKNIDSGQWWLLACIIGSCFIFSQTWWARYISQLWLIVPIAIAISWKAGHSKLGTTISALAFAAGAWALCGTMTRSIAFTYYRHAIYGQLHGKETAVQESNPQTLRHLREHGIAYREAADSTLSPTRQAYFFGDYNGKGGALLELDCEASEFVDNAPESMRGYFSNRTSMEK